MPNKTTRRISLSVALLRSRSRKGGGGNQLYSRNSTNIPGDLTSDRQLGGEDVCFRLLFFFFFFFSPRGGGARYGEESLFVCLGGTNLFKNNACQ